MKMIKQLMRIALAAVVAVLALVPAMAYTVYTGGYQARIGAYTAYAPYGQGFYDYLTPPTALTRYGAEYHYSNIRSAVYPSYPWTGLDYTARLYRPYFGYPYGTGSPVVSWRSSGIYGGGGGFIYAS